ncbi:MAG: AAA family ATPase [Planctomycetota bacterium]
MPDHDEDDEDEEEDEEDEAGGTPVPAADRDRPTPPKLLAAVLARDKNRCLCCGSRKSLTGHHKIERQHGGRTDLRNVMTLCDDCHSLVHSGKLIVHGAIPDGLWFSDARGRNVRELGLPLDLVLEAIRRDARASSARISGLRDLPGSADPDWWDRHGHLLRWDPKQGCLELEPGVPREPRPHEDTSPDGDARASRPRTLADMIGQDRVVENLRVTVDAAKRVGDAVPHVLLCGPPGLGKTRLGGAVAGEAGAAFHHLSAPAVKEPGILLRQLTSLRDGDVLFLDEIHRLPAAIAEILYEAMEDGSLSLPVRCGNDQRVLHVRLNRFTLIGATTEEELLPAPLLGRFVIREHLEFYGIGELARLVERAAADRR